MPPNLSHDLSQYLSLTELKLTELLSLPRDKTAFIFNIGRLNDPKYSVSTHSAKMSLAEDLIKALGTSDQIIKKASSSHPDWMWVLMPSIPYVGKEVLIKDTLVEQCLWLNRMGFKTFFCVSGTRNPKTLTAIEEASKKIHSWIRPRGALYSLSSVTISKTEFKSSWLKWDPTFGSPPIDQLADAILLKIKPVLDGTVKTAVDFRSWYSLLPQHSTYRMHWLMALTTLMGGLGILSWFLQGIS